MVTNQLQGTAHVIPLQAFGPDEHRTAIRADQVDLGLPVTKHMHMGRLVIVREDDDAQTMRPMDRDHGSI